MSDLLPSKLRVYRLGDAEDDLFSDAMDRAVSAHHSYRHGVLRNAENSGALAVDGEKIARRGLAIAINAYLEEVGPDVETSSPPTTNYTGTRDQQGCTRCGFSVWHHACPSVNNGPLGDRSAAETPAESEWVAVTERLPASGVKVLGFWLNQLGKKRTTCVEYVAPRTRDASESGWDDTPDDWFDCDESGTCWVPSGWYERVEGLDEYPYTEIDVTHWAPIRYPASPVKAEALHSDPARIEAEQFPEAQP